MSQEIKKEYGDGTFKKVKENLDRFYQLLPSINNDYNPQVVAEELGLPIDLIEEFISDFIEQANESKSNLYDACTHYNENQVYELSNKLNVIAKNLKIDKSISILDDIENTLEEKGVIFDSKEVNKISNYFGNIDYDNFSLDLLEEDLFYFIFLIEYKSTPDYFKKVFGELDNQWKEYHEELYGSDEMINKHVKNHVDSIQEALSTIKEIQKIENTKDESTLTMDEYISLKKKFIILIHKSIQIEVQAFRDSSKEEYSKEYETWELENGKQYLI